MKMTPSNYLSLARILLVPVLVVVLLTRIDNYHIIGVIVFWIAAITDGLDGYLARRWRQVTKLGTLLDPLADKMLITGALISLIELQHDGHSLAPAWMVFLILIREFAITGLRSIAAEEGLIISAGILGKWKVGLQITAISLLILGPKLDQLFYEWTDQKVFQYFITLRYPFPFFLGMGTLILWASLLVALWSGYQYLSAYWKHLQLTGDFNND
ncbi:MAG: CDP-diacylglycerol--glycerol-3-phosphate 3-phosphatidyltransferase [Holophagaceae bacterium]